MPAGLQLFHKDGSIDIDTSTGIPRYLGTTPSVYSGSIIVPEWETQRPWFVIVRDIYGRSPLNIDYFTMDISGTKLSWNLIPSAAYGPTRVQYGCF